MVGYCEYHDEAIDLNKFEWKGCWSCHYFIPDKNFPFVDVTDAADILGVSRSTIIHWIKNGKLKGRLFERGRHLSFLSPPYRKYFITSSSLDSFIHEDMEKQGITEDDILENLKEYEGICSVCGRPLVRGYEYKTQNFGLESGIHPLQHLTYECEKCGTVIKKDVNGFFVYGDVVDFDENSVTIRTPPPPPSPYISGSRIAETKETITIQHNLDLSKLKRFMDNLEDAEILVINNKAVQIKG